MPRQPTGGNPIYYLAGALAHNGLTEERIGGRRLD